MGMIVVGKFFQCLSGFYCYLVVGFWGEVKNNFGGVNGVVDLWLVFGWIVGFDVVKFVEEIDFVLCILCNVFFVVVEFIEQWVERGEVFSGGWVVVFYQGNGWCGFVWNEIVFVFVLVKYFEWL